MESAIFNICSGFGETEVYPVVEEKAARIALGIVNNHALFDDDKRIGMLSMLMILWLFGLGKEDVPQKGMFSVFRPYSTNGEFYI